MRSCDQALFAIEAAGFRQDTEELTFMSYKKQLDTVGVGGWCIRHPNKLLCPLPLVLWVESELWIVQDDERKGAPPLVLDDFVSHRKYEGPQNRPYPRRICNESSIDLKVVAEPSVDGDLAFIEFSTFEIKTVLEA